MVKIAGIAFDAYGTLFDVYSVATLGEEIYPGKGAELAAIWRSKQIEYTHLRTLSDRYKPFWEVTRDALRYAIRKLELPVNDASIERLMLQYDALTAFPENLTALRALKALKIPLVILSNGTQEMLRSAVASAGMTGLFDHLLSVDAVGRYKTSPQAYALGPAALGVAAEEILFVSSNGWDACGASWYGYTSFWINRSGQPAEELDIQPRVTGNTLTSVVDYVRGLAGPAV